MVLYLRESRQRLIPKIPGMKSWNIPQGIRTMTVALEDHVVLFLDFLGFSEASVQSDI